MAISEEALNRAYERACGVLHRMSYSSGAPGDPRALLDGLAAGYAIADGYLREITPDEDGCFTGWMAEADRICMTIREAAMAVVARCMRPKRGELDDGEAHDRLVEQFKMPSDKADLFVNLLTLSLRGGVFEAARCRGRGSQITNVLDVFRSLTVSHGRINFGDIADELKALPV